MALRIDHPEVDELARRLASCTGESIADAVLVALRERLMREEQRPRAVSAGEALRRIAERVKALPVLDRRSDDAILGYDDRGLPR